MRRVQSREGQHLAACPDMAVPPLRPFGLHSQLSRRRPRPSSGSSAPSAKSAVSGRSASSPIASSPPYNSARALIFKYRFSTSSDRFCGVASRASAPAWRRATERAEAVVEEHGGDGAFVEVARRLGRAPGERVEFVIAQGRAQYQMATGQRAHVPEQAGGGVRVRQIGEQDNERPLAQAVGHIHESPIIIALDRLRLQPVQRLQHVAELVLARRHEPHRLARERIQPHPIAQTRRDIRPARRPRSPRDPLSSTAPDGWPWSGPGRGRG